MLNTIRAALATFPEHDEILVEEEEFERVVTPLLVGRVFHITAFRNVRSIVASGAILPNRDGQFDSSFAGSRFELWSQAKLRVHVRLSHCR